MASELAWQVAELEAIKQATAVVRSKMTQIRQRNSGADPIKVKVVDVELDVQVAG
jgi:hypothetical protein